MGSGLRLNISEVMHWEHVEKRIKVRSFRCRTGKVLVLVERARRGRKRLVG